MPSTIQETLLAALAADSQLNTIIGHRIFPGEVPDDQEQTPWLFYAIPESTPFDSLDDEGGQDVRSEAEFHSLADRYSDAKAIIDRVNAVLNAMAGGAVLKSVLWNGTSEETTEEGYHHVIRFTVFWLKA